MRLFNARTTVVCFSFFVSTALFATKGQEILDTGTVKQQFDYVLEKSSTYEQYKVIKNTWARKLRKHVLDSLDLARNRYNQSQVVINEKQSMIDSLEASMSQTKTELARVTREKNSFSLFGLLISKGSYNSLMWGIVLVLVALLTVLFVLFKRSNAITVRTKKDLTETKEEFESHRKRAREREERTARKHLDEILKYKNQQQPLGR